MVSPKEIQAACDDIVREFAPLQIILFGSYAYGAPMEDSDVDRHPHRGIIRYVSTRSNVLRSI